MTTPPDIPATTPLARARRRLEARLRVLDDELVDHPKDEVMWTRYVLVAHALAAVSGGQPAPPIITTQQLADSLGISAETVRDMVKQGRLEPAAKFGGRGGFRFRTGQRPKPK